MKKRRKPTQSDLDAANREAKDYLRQVRELQAEQATAEASARERAEFAYVTSLCNVIESCSHPPTFLTGAIGAPGQCVTFTHVAFADLLRLAKLARVLMVKGNSTT